MALNVINVVVLHLTLGFAIFSALFFTSWLWLSYQGTLRRTYCQDVIMVVAFILYTASILLINVSSAYPLSISTSKLDSNLSDSEYLHQLVVGSVLVIATEQCMLFTTWALKSSVIAFLYRLTRHLPSARLMLIVIATYISSGLIALEICFYAVLCTPISAYWSLPVENPQCASHLTFATTEMVFDISAILLIIAVAGFIAYQSNLPKNRVITLLGLVSISAFTIASAVMKRFYKSSSPGNLDYSLWCIMELSTMLWIANWIHFWPLFQKLFNCGTFAYSFSHTAQNSIGGQPSSGDVPIGVTNLAWGRLTNSAWSSLKNSVWSRLVTALTTRRVENATEQDVEMVGPNIPRSAHAASASMGTTIMIHAELADYLDHGPATPHSQQLTRDDDTSPALIYREINRLD